MRKKGKRMRKLRRQIEGTVKYARGRRIVASYMLNQVMFSKVTTRNVTLITFITGEILKERN